MEKGKNIRPIFVALVIIISIFIATLINIILMGDKTNQENEVQEKTESVTVTETVTEHRANEDTSKEETSEDSIDIDEGELERLMKDISIKTR